MSRPTVRVARIGQTRYAEVRRAHHYSIRFTASEAREVALGLADVVEEIGFLEQQEEVSKDD